jgi:hypothetical protein
MFLSITFQANRKTVLLYLVLKQGLKSGKRFECSGLCSSFRLCCAERFFIQVFLMLVIVAIETEQLPVAAVLRIVVVVVVLVMDRELFELFAGELAAAARAEVRVNLERLLTVRLLPKLPAAPGLRYDLSRFLWRGFV